MRVHRYWLLWISLWLLSSHTCFAQGQPPLVLEGGTVVDLTNWGRSAKDLRDAIVIIREGKISEVGPRSAVQIPKGARVLDCSQKFILPGLVDGFTGMNTQGQANAYLYMGVTTVVVSSDSHRGRLDRDASPSPNVYLLDSVGTTDDWSLLIGHNGWTQKLRQSGRPAELTPSETLKQMTDTAKLGTRVIWLGPELTAANTQWIISHARQFGLVTYGEFAATPYSVAIESGVDVLLHMGRYELGVIPEELQRPLADDPEGGAATTAYGYAERLPPSDAHLHWYARLIGSHRSALMPTFSQYFQRLPDHRNLWTEPAAALLDPSRMFDPPGSKGEMTYPLPNWARHLPGTAQRYVLESQKKKADQSAMRLWKINQTLFSASPHYLAATGAPVHGSFPGISLHVEMEMLVRLGLTPREALASASSNYALQFNWNELGLIAPGRRADVLIVDADPTVNIWNSRRINTLILDGNVLDREALLNLKK